MFRIICWRINCSQLQFVFFCVNTYDTKKAFVLQSFLIEEDLVVFVCSTTGQGDPPDNMKVCTSLLSIHKQGKAQ